MANIIKLATISLTGLMASFAGSAYAQGGFPDAVYLNGKVITVDRAFSIAEAFAVQGDRIVAVGASAAVKALAGPDTRVHDLSGRTVTPGFVDTHPHFYPAPAISLVGVDSVEAILQRIRAGAAAAKPGEWIVTSAIGVPPDYFAPLKGLAERRWPSLAELDSAAPNNPVYIPGPSVWPHPSLFNSKGLELLGVGPDTPDDGRVQIEKDTQGHPTGAIRGLDIYNKKAALYGKLQAMLPAPDMKATVDGLRMGLNDYVTTGVTALYAAHGFNPAEFRQQVERVNEAGQPVPRIVSAYQVPKMPLAEIRPWMNALTDAKDGGTGDDTYKTLGVAVAMDGATQFGEAFMKEPYLNPDGQRGNGVSSVSKEELAQIARSAFAEDLRLNILLAGDGAGEWAVEAMDKVHRETPITERRWVVQHFQHPTQKQIATLKSMGVLATTYSAVDYEKGAATYIDRFPGRDVWKSVVPLRWWLDGGMTVAQGTDGRHKDPMFTLWASLTRIDGRTGKSLLTPEKEISRREALEIYTIHGARILEWEDQIGSLEAGKFADFVVLDRDILEVPVDEIRETKVLATAIGGRIVHGSIP